jgi:hypothetical protein
MIGGYYQSVVERPHALFANNAYIHIPLIWSWQGPVTIEFYMRAPVGSDTSIFQFDTLKYSNTKRFLASLWSNNTLYYDMPNITTGRVNTPLTSMTSYLNKWIKVTLFTGGNQTGGMTIKLNDIIVAQKGSSLSTESTFDGLDIARHAFNGTGTLTYWSGRLANFKVWQGNTLFLHLPLTKDANDISGNNRHGQAYNVQFINNR